MAPSLIVTVLEWVVVVPIATIVLVLPILIVCSQTYLWIRDRLRVFLAIPIVSKTLQWVAHLIYLHVVGYEELARWEHLDSAPEDTRPFSCGHDRRSKGNIPSQTTAARTAIPHPPILWKDGSLRIKASCGATVPSDLCPVCERESDLARLFDFAGQVYGIQALESNEAPTMAANSSNQPDLTACQDINDSIAVQGSDARGHLFQVRVCRSAWLAFQERESVVPRKWAGLLEDHGCRDDPWMFPPPGKKR